jgi:hypothetical protein
MCERVRPVWFARLIVLYVCVASMACQRTAPTPEATDLQTFKKKLLESGYFLGGPEPAFEAVGRKTLAIMIDNGLEPSHKVLDIGAGSLRVGWWLLHYVEPSNYYAIEPVKERIDGAAKLLGADINIFYNEDFEFPPDVKFDFVLARSIWTHASKAMIAKMLSEFRENAAPGSRFLTSVDPARSPAEDYMGVEWVGKVEDADKPGMVKHSLVWIDEECKKNGLRWQEKGTLFDQTWLLIELEPSMGR